MQHDGIQPNVHTYTTLMNAYARVGNREQAEDVLLRMTQAKCMPNVFTFTVLINAYARAGDVEGAENVLKRMKAQGVEPNLMSYNTLLTAMQKQAERRGGMSPSQAQQALQLYRWMRSGENPNIRPDGATLSLMMACALHFPNDVLLTVYESLVSDLRRIVPVRKRKARLFLQALDLCAAAQDRLRLDNVLHDAQELARAGHIASKDMGRVINSHRSCLGRLCEPPW